MLCIIDRAPRTVPTFTYSWKRASDKALTFHRRNPPEDVEPFKLKGAEWGVYPAPGVGVYDRLGGVNLPIAG